MNRGRCTSAWVCHTTIPGTQRTPYHIPPSVPPSDQCRSPVWHHHPVPSWLCLPFHHNPRDMLPLPLPLQDLHPIHLRSSEPCCPDDRCMRNTQQVFYRLLYFFLPHLQPLFRLSPFWQLPFEALLQFHFSFHSVPAPLLRIPPKQRAERKQAASLSIFFSSYLMYPPYSASSIRTS